MKKSWKPSFLILVLILPFITQLAIVANYIVQTSDYEKYCINKENPAMACHGKCKVQKELNALENEDGKNHNNIPYTIKAKETIHWVIEEVTTLDIVLNVIQANCNQPNILCYKLRYTTSIFQPPENSNC